MKEMIKMYIKCEKIKELAEKIEKETLNDCEVKYEGNEDEHIKIWTKTYECFSYTSERGLIFEMQDGYLTGEEIEYLFNEYKKIKEVLWRDFFALWVWRVPINLHTLLFLKSMSVPLFLIK